MDKEVKTEVCITDHIPISSSDVDYKCNDCDDSIVIWDAYAVWDAEDQKHILYSSFDHCECHNCGSTDIEEIAFKQHES